MLGLAGVSLAPKLSSHYYKNAYIECFFAYEYFLEL
jgi:hypothetical protein